MAGATGPGGAPGGHLREAIAADPVLPRSFEGITVTEALGLGLGPLAPVFNAVPEMIVVLQVEEGPSFRFVSVNDAYRSIIGLSAEAVVGKRVQDVMKMNEAQLAIQKSTEAVEMGVPVRYEERMRKAGTKLYFDATATPLLDDQGRCSAVLWVARDITAMKEAEEELRKKTAILKLLQGASAAANRASTLEEAARIVIAQICGHTRWPAGHLYLVDDDGRLFPSPVWWLEDPVRFRQFRNVTETSIEAANKGLAQWVVLSKKPQWIRDVSKNKHFDRHHLAKVLSLRGAYAFPLLVGRKVVAVLEFFSYASADPDGALREVMSMISDQLARVAERQTATEQLQRNARELRSLSLRDDLTGVNNRRGFITLSEFQLKLAHRAGKEVHLFFVDLDNMKEINDQHGHYQGDVALIDLTQILVATFRESDILARVGGDEFCVLLTSAGEEGISHSFTRLDEAVQAYNDQRIRPYEVSISVGISTFDPDDPCTIEELIDRADMAMYRVKLGKRALAESS